MSCIRIWLSDFPKSLQNLGRVFTKPDAVMFHIYLKYLGKNYYIFIKFSFKIEQLDKDSLSNYSSNPTDSNGPTNNVVHGTGTFRFAVSVFELEFKILNFFKSNC